MIHNYFPHKTEFTSVFFDSSEHNISCYYTIKIHICQCCGTYFFVQHLQHYHIGLPQKLFLDNTAEIKPQNKNFNSQYVSSAEAKQNHLI